MIYTIVGTDVVRREKTYQELEKVGAISTHIYNEQIGGLEALIEASSLFGEKVVVNVLQVMDDVKARDVLIELLPSMKESSNIFIIDEPFADANRVTRLTKYSAKVFDARLPKEKDVDVFTLCTLFAKRDKKALWVEWMRVRNLDSPEAIQGALWWKFTTIWSDVRNGRPSKFTQTECEEIGRRLVRAPILAHRGEADLRVEIERILLSV
jgi:hypothetical protein